MIVQPTPARPPGRRPPVAAVAVGLLTVVTAMIAVATLGPQVEPVDPPPAFADEPTRTSRETSMPTTRPAVADPGFPAEVAGLPVQDVVEVVDGRRTEGLTGLVAVAGYLTVSGRPSECPPPTVVPRTTTAGRARPFCRREAVIASSPEGAIGDPGREPSTWARGPHLHAQVAPGTTLPYLVEPPFGNDRREGIPVVVLASFDDGRTRTIGCGMEVFYCFEKLLIERVLWADGRWQDRRTAVDPVLTAGPILDGRERLAITSLAVPGSGPVLGEALLPHGSLGDVDPAAAEASEPTDRPVWYLRLLAPGRPGEPGGVAWLVLEDGSGRILARGGAG